MTTEHGDTTPALSFKGNVAWSALGRSISLLGVIGWSILTARLLGAAGAGRLDLIVNFWRMAGVVVGVNLIYPHQYYAAKRQYATSTIAQFTTAFVPLAAALTALAFHLLYPVLQIHVFREVDVALLWLGFALLPLMQWSQLLGAIWRGLHNFGICAWAEVANHTTRLAGLVVLMLWAEANVNNVLWVALLGALVLLVYYLSKTVPQIGWRGLLPRLDLDYASKAFSLSLRSWLEIITQDLNCRLDVFIIAALLQARDVGVYRRATQVAELPSMVGPTVGPVLLARVAADEGRHPTLTLSVLRQVLLATTMIALLVGTTGRWLLEDVFGREFGEGSLALILLLPGTVALSARSILSNALKGRELPEYVTYSALIGLLITVPLDFLLIPAWGIAGAAAASTSAYLAVLFFLTWAYRKDTQCAVCDMLPSWQDLKRLWAHVRNLTAKGLSLLRRVVHSPDAGE